MSDTDTPNERRSDPEKYQTDWELVQEAPNEEDDDDAG